MPAIDWFWFIIGILVGKYVLDFVTMFLMTTYSRISGGSSASLSGM